MDFDVANFLLACHIGNLSKLREFKVSKYQYWVVGAMWEGKEDQLDKFISRGYWYLGWSDKAQPAQAKRRDKMRVGDRIAIKRMLGQGSPKIAIRALGIIREIDEDDHDKHRRVYVDWLVEFPPKEERKVSGKGCFDSIHGPYRDSDPWIQEVFHL